MNPDSFDWFRSFLVVDRSLLTSAGKQLSGDDRTLLTEAGRYLVRSRVGAKFSDDHVLERNDSYLLVLDGVVLNRKELFGEEGHWKMRLLADMIEDAPGTLGRLRGSYYGCLIDKRSNEVIVFCDHIKSKQLYYADNGKGFIAGGTLKEVRDLLAENAYPVTINQRSAYHLLTYGFMLDGETMAEGISRIPVGKYLRFTADEKTLIQYFALNGTAPTTLTYQQAIDRCDELFKNAVDRAFRKDTDYGYRHVASLSGGLDSRMTVFTAHNLGYTEQLNLTFSQSHYLDETIAHEIAIDLDHEWQFRNLDGGNFFYGIDELAHLTEGNGYLFSVAHGYRTYQSLPREDIGIIHTGQVGDGVLAVGKPATAGKNFTGYKAYDDFLLNRLEQFAPEAQYETDYQHYLHNRVFNGANVGLAGAQKYSETYSPFYDVDFLNFALSLPEEWRLRHKFYLDWVKQKYPGAAQYVWESTGLPLNERQFRIAGKKITKSKLKQGVTKRLTGVFGGGRKHRLNTVKHMNPVDHWYNNNTRFKGRLDNYLRENIDIITDKQLRDDCMSMYAQPKTIGKIQVVSLLATIQYLNR